MIHLRIPLYANPIIRRCAGNQSLHNRNAFCNTVVCIIFFRLERGVFTCNIYDYEKPTKCPRYEISICEISPFTLILIILIRFILVKILYIFRFKINSKHGLAELRVRSCAASTVKIAFMQSWWCCTNSCWLIYGRFVIGTCAKQAHGY